MNVQPLHQNRFQFGEDKCWAHFYSLEEADSGGPVYLIFILLNLTDGWINKKLYNYRWPDGDGHELGGEEGGDDAVAETEADIGEDDGDHGDEVEALGEGGGQVVVGVQERVHRHRGEGEEDQGARARKQEPPGNIILKIVKPKF